MNKGDIRRIREFLDYDPETGIFRWKKLTKRSNNTGVGMEAGSLTQAGYRTISVEMVKYLSHRLAWAYVYGEWPDGFIDHINRVKSDNRITNLRVVDSTGSAQNRDSNKRNKTGFAGVKKEGEKYLAVISFGKAKQKVVGRFSSPEDAHKCYMDHKKIMHPYWAGSN